MRLSAGAECRENPLLQYYIYIAADGTHDTEGSSRMLFNGNDSSYNSPVMV